MLLRSRDTAVRQDEARRVPRATHAATQIDVLSQDQRARRTAAASRRIQLASYTC